MTLSYNKAYDKTEKLELLKALLSYMKSGCQMWVTGDILNRICDGGGIVSIMH